MGKIVLTNDYYYVKTRDKIGGTIRTDVFRKEDGTFQAYSSYAQDEEIVGFAENNDDEQAISISRKDLRKEWNEEQERKLARGIK